MIGLRFSMFYLFFLNWLTNHSKLKFVLSRALAKRPADRYPTTEVFAESFSQAAQGALVSMRPLFSLPILAQMYKAPATHSDWENSSVPVTTLTTPGSSYYPSQVSNSSGSAL